MTHKARYRVVAHGKRLGTFTKARATRFKKYINKNFHAGAKLVPVRKRKRR